MQAARQKTRVSCLLPGVKCALITGITPPVGALSMNKILLGTLLFSPLLAAAATRPSSAPRRKAPPKPSFARMPDWLRWITSCQPSIPGDCRVLPEQQKSERAIQRGWIKGRNDCWKAGDLRQCVEESYQLRITELQIKGPTESTDAGDYQCGKSVTSPSTSTTRPSGPPPDQPERG